MTERRNDIKQSDDNPMLNNEDIFTKSNRTFTPFPTYEELLEKSKENKDFDPEWLEMARELKLKAESLGISEEEYQKLQFEEQLRHMTPEEQDKWMFLRDDLSNVSIDTGVNRINMIKKYADNAVKEGAFQDQDEYYYASGINRGNFNYPKKFHRIVFEEFITGGGGSKTIKGSELEKSFTDKNYHGTIGKKETGQFVTIAVDDSKLIKESFLDRNKEDAYRIIAEAKGLGHYSGETLYQLIFDVDFVKDIEEKGLFCLADGSEKGANSLFIPGARTFSEDIGKSQREAIFPAINIKGIKFEEVRSCVSNNKTFVIHNPTVVDKNGKEFFTQGTISIRKL